MENDKVLQLNTAERVFGNRKIMNMVQYASHELERKLNDVTSFEHSCYHRIMASVDKIESQGGEVTSIEGLANRIVKLAKKDWYKNRVVTEAQREWYEKHPNAPKLEITYYEGFSKGEGDKAFDIEDTNLVPAVEALIASEEEIELNKKISTLASGDLKKEMILKMWSNGFSNDVELSNLLAQKLGGKAESHRKYIVRFRAKCREEFSA